MMLRHNQNSTTTEAHKAVLELLCSQLHFGETRREVCPKCHGGSSKERSFSYSRDLGSICYFKCFRDKCGFRGRFTLAPSHSDATSARTQNHRDFRHTVEPLNDSDVSIFRELFDVNPDRSIYWCPELNRYAHRVYAPDGAQRGWQARDYCGLEQVKAISYPFKDLTGPFVGWYIPDLPIAEGVVVVEDLMSSKKVSDSGYNCVALLGTWIDLERAYEIKEVAKGGTVHLALDEGTMASMIKYRDKLGAIWEDNVKIWLLKKDLKYVSRERIREAFRDGAINFRGDEEKSP